MQCWGVSHLGRGGGLRVCHIYVGVGCQGVSHLGRGGVLRYVPSK